MYITQISVRSLCISAKQLRPVDGENTGNTSPSSILHPQHIHLVVVEHMVQFLIVSNGIRHGSSWYLASGRIAFAFSSQYRLIKVQPILCAQHPRDATASQKCTNCELIFEFECPRIQIQKKFMCIRSTQKNMRIYNYTWTKFHFHARAPRICHLYFDFQGFVYYTLVYLFTKWFLWKFVEEKITKKFWKYGIFSFFWKWLKFKTC